jgi:hypothetical protein
LPGVRFLVTVCRSCLSVFSLYAGRGAPRKFCPVCAPPGDRVASVRLWRVANREYEQAHKRLYHKRTYVGKPPREGTCERCGTAFVTTQDTRRFCSRECYRAWRPRTSVPWIVRQRVLRRDDWHCYLCAGDIDRTVRWPHARSGTVDHVFPVSAGGTDALENLRAAHWGCNEAKGDRLPTIWERRAAGMVA